MFDGQAWIVWLGVALVLVAIEAATVDFVFLMLGGGALGGAVAAGLGASLPVQALVAAGTAGVLLFAVRPWLKKRFSNGPRAIMGAEAHVGSSAYVLERVNQTSGQVKLAGSTWTARTTSGSIEPGEEVIVDSIDGATAIVSRAPRAVDR